MAVRLAVVVVLVILLGSEACNAAKKSKRRRQQEENQNVNKDHVVDDNAAISHDLYNRALDDDENSDGFGDSADLTKVFMNDQQKERQISTGEGNKVTVKFPEVTNITCK